MKKYYCIITQEQLNQLLSFGEIFLPEYLAIDFTEEKENIQKNLVNSFNSFIRVKYDELVLVIECRAKLNTQNRSLKIQIADIEQIFPISDEGQRALAFKYPKINFSFPILETESLSNINDNYFVGDIKNGVTCLKSVFDDLFTENDNIDEEKITQAALKFRKGMRLSMLSDNSDIIDFTFLYVYQEHYPLNTLGYFFRTAEILIRKKTLESGKKSENSIDLFKKSDIFKFLESLKLENKDYKVQDIDTLLNENTSIKIRNFIETLTISGVKFFIVIPIFLKIIDEFNSNNQNLEKTLLEYIRGSSYVKEYPKECQQLIIWLGAYLGYGNCYDYYYSKNNLKILKSYKPQVLSSDEDIQISKKSLNKMDKREVDIKKNSIIANTAEINEEITHLSGESCPKVGEVKWREKFLISIKENTILKEKQLTKLDELIFEYINSKASSMYEEILNENKVLDELLTKIKVSLKLAQKKEHIIHEIKPFLPINEIFDEIQKLRNRTFSKDKQQLI